MGEAQEAAWRAGRRNHAPRACPRVASLPLETLEGLPVLLVPRGHEARPSRDRRDDALDWEKSSAGDVLASVWHFPSILPVLRGKARAILLRRYAARHRIGIVALCSRTLRRA